MSSSADTAEAFARIEAALALLAAASERAQADNQRLRTAMGEALGEIDALIARVEATP